MTMLSDLTASGQDFIPEIKKREFTLEDGLPDNFIRSLTIDNLGFLWIGTHSGLSRYDGHTFTNYYCLPEDTNSLSGNVIVCINKDSRGDLWISTEENGLCLFDPAKNNFRRYDISQKGYGYLPGKNPAGIMEDRNGRIWVTLFGDGIAWLNPATNAFELVKLDQDTLPYNHNEVKEGVTDRDGNFWLPSRKGLVCFNPYTRAVKFFDRYAATKNEEKAINLLTCIAKDKENNLFIGTWDRGLYTYNIQNNEWHQYLPDASLRDGKNRINDIQIRDDQSINISTTAYGVITIQSEISLLDNYIQKAEIKSSAGTAITTLSCGNITYEGYSNRLVRTTNLGEIIRYFPGSKVASDSKGFATISSIRQFNNTTMLLGSYYRRGLFEYDLPSKTYRHVPIKEGREELFVFDIEKDLANDDGYWLGTSSGVYYYDARRTLVWENPVSKQFNKDSLWIYDLYQHKDRSLWMCGKNFVLTQQHGEVADHSSELKKLSDKSGQHYNGIIRYDENTLLTWTDAGEVFLIHLQGETTYQYEKLKTPLLSARLIQVVVDPQKRLWMGLHNNGVLCYHRSKHQTEHYTTTNGLSGSKFVSMITNSSDQLWVLSQQGLSLIRMSTGFTINFNHKIPNIISEPNLLITLNDSTLLLAGDEEFAILDINELLKEDIPRRVILTGCMVNDDMQFTSVFQDTTTIRELRYQENTIVLSFTVPDPTGMSQHHFEYRLEGIDNNWINIGTDRKLRLARLSPGKYTLLLRAYLPASGKRSLPNICRFIIPPPFYRESWFIIMSIIISAAAGYLMLKQREKKVRKNEQEKQTLQQRMAELENQALKSQMNPHFIFNCLNSINGYILKNNTDTAIRFVNKFAKLIRYILEKSSEKEIALEEELAALNTYIEIEAIRLHHSFQYVINVDRSLSMQGTRLPPLIIQPLVENAIWHGMHGIEKAGMIRINIRPVGHYIQIDVEDNGIGYSQSLKSRADRTIEKKSMGISITKQRLQLIRPADASAHELLTVTDRFNEEGVQEGTIATLYIPINSAV